MGKKAKKAKKQYRAALARVGSSLLTQAERFKYSDSQPRDDHGRFAGGEGGSSGLTQWAKERDAQAAGDKWRAGLTEVSGPRAAVRNFRDGRGDRWVQCPADGVFVNMSAAAPGKDPITDRHRDHMIGNAFKYSDAQPRDGQGRWTSGEDVRTGYAPARGDVLHQHSGPTVHGHPGFHEAAMAGLHAHRPMQGVAIRGYRDASGAARSEPVNRDTPVPHERFPYNEQSMQVERQTATISPREAARQNASLPEGSGWVQVTPGREYYDASIGGMRPYGQEMNRETGVTRWIGAHPDEPKA